MTSFVTRFRPIPPDSRPPDALPDSAPTMDASMRMPSAQSSSPFETVADHASRPMVVDPSLPPGPTVDGARYDVKSVLGRGGMGEVRLCHDTRIGRDVAIKVATTRQGVDDGIRARFLRESRVQGQLEHPAIVPVYDLEVFDDGSAYFAMKRVKGLTLATILGDVRRGDPEATRRFPLRKLLAAFNSICIAVDFAHTKGVVHRDIKPGNIMLGDFGEVYLLDWGLAKVVAHDDDEPRSARDTSNAPIAEGDATLVGSVLGTPGYMAPEQIDESVGPIAPVTDVYALGAVLFDILAREHFIETRDYVEATLATLQGTAERHPSKRAQPAVAELIAPALDEVCARALSRNPADRYPSARALHDAIDAHLAGEHDLERRRALSLAHTAEAAKQPDTDAGRVVALKQLGSAIALDPDNADARRALVRLLTTSPTEIPPAVQQRIEEDEAGRVRSIARMRASSGLVFLPFVPFAFAVGVREPWIFAASLAGIMATSAASFVLSRSSKPSFALQLVAHALFLAGCVGLARIAGPFMLLPALFLAYSVELQMHPHVIQRRVAMIAACASLGLAFGIEGSGLVAPSYTIVDGGIFVHSNMLELDGFTLWFLAAAGVGTILTPSLFAAKARAALTTAEAKLHLQAWQLAQIVPQDVRAAPQQR